MKPLLKLALYLGYGVVFVVACLAIPFVIAYAAFVDWADRRERRRRATSTTTEGEPK